MYLRYAYIYILLYYTRMVIKFANLLRRKKRHH
jgi:hypothetical protein